MCLASRPYEYRIYSATKAMYDTTMSQVYALCSLNVDSGQGEYVDALVRARIFWYAHVIDGVTSGLRGGRIAL